MTKLTKTEEAIDTACLAIRAAKASADQLINVSSNLAKELQALENALHVLRGTGLFDQNRDLAESIRMLNTRIIRLNEMKNQMELGAFGLQVKRITENAWLSLPQ